MPPGGALPLLDQGREAAVVDQGVADGGKAAGGLADASRRSSTQPPAAAAILRFGSATAAKGIELLKEIDEGRDQQAAPKALGIQPHHKRNQVARFKLRLGDEAGEGARVMGDIGIAQPEIGRVDACSLAV